VVSVATGRVAVYVQLAIDAAATNVHRPYDNRASRPRTAGSLTGRTAFSRRLILRTGGFPILGPGPSLRCSAFRMTRGRCATFKACRVPQTQPKLQAWAKE
jgi:hypothetical protein